MNIINNRVFALITAIVSMIMVVTVMVSCKKNIDDAPLSGGKDTTVEDIDNSLENDGSHAENGKSEDDPVIDNKENGEENEQVDTGEKDESDSSGSGTKKPSNNTDKNDRSDKDNKEPTDTKKPEETKKPSPNGNSSSQKEPSGNTGSDENKNDNGTSKEDNPYVPEPMSYADFIEMSPEDQQAYFESFENMQDYFNWYNDALEKYEEEQNKIEGSGSINIGDIIDGNGN